MAYPEVIHRQLWITLMGGPIFTLRAAQFSPSGQHTFHPSPALASVHTVTHRTRTLKLDGTKIACLFLQAQLLLFRRNHFGKADPGIELK
jgi:hypothetical protein